MLCTLLLQVSAFAQDEYKSEKKVDHTYKVSSNATLDIDNQFASLTIETWDKAEVKIDASISARTNKKETTDLLLSSLGVEHSMKNNTVNIKAGIIHNTGKNNNIKGKTSFEVDMIIYAPRDISLVLKNKFGKVVLPKLTNKVNLDVEFGNVEVSEIGANNKIRVKFGGLKIDKITNPDIVVEFLSGRSIVSQIEGTGKITSKFSNVCFNVTKGGNIDVVTEFGDVYLVHDKTGAQNITVQTEFGKLKNNSSLPLMLKESNHNKAKYTTDASGSGQLNIVSKFTNLTFSNTEPPSSFYKKERKD